MIQDDILNGDTYSVSSLVEGKHDAVRPVFCIYEIPRPTRYYLGILISSKLAGKGAINSLPVLASYIFNKGTNPRVSITYNN